MWIADWKVSRYLLYAYKYLRNADFKDFVVVYNILRWPNDTQYQYAEDYNGFYKPSFYWEGYGTRTQKCGSLVEQSPIVCMHTQ